MKHRPRPPLPARTPTACSALLLVVLLMGCGDAEPPATSSHDVAQGPSAAELAQTAAWRTRIQPMLGDYCVGCHSGAEPEGSLDLDLWASSDAPPTAGVLREEAVLAEHLANHVAGGLMPPPGEPRPDEAARKAFSTWWTDALAAAWAAAPPDPGRVTMRRLNRYEYQRTVKDLLGVDFDTSRTFPSDDVGYGFDHIGDVLSLPPILFEKYLDAAERISDKALVVIDPNAPNARRHAAEHLAILGGGRAASEGAFFFSNGEVRKSMRFRRTGTYVVRVHASAQQAGPEPARMTVRLDRRVLASHAVKAIVGDPKTYEVKARISAGTYDVAAAFVNDYYKPRHPDPKQRDRNLFIHWVEVQGPLEGAAASLPATHRAIIPCEPAPGEERACAEVVFEKLLRRAYRRPPSAVEIEKHVGLVMRVMAEGEPFTGAVQVALQAVLVSPHFLFRVELDARSGPGTKALPLDDHQLASRLAYFLWSSIPDQELDDLADAGTLRAHLHDQVARMLDHRRAGALVENFAVQWLELRRLDIAAPDPGRFKTFDEQLRASMRRETELLFQAVVREDRSILDLLDAPFTYVDPLLAKHYGMGDLAGKGFRRVPLVGGKRGGLLGHASILTLTSYPTRTSPVQRGKWLMEEILGTPPPPPPPGVGALEMEDPALIKLTLRERLQKHREDPSCAVCHDRMDNLGYGLEGFDPVGAVRVRDGAVKVDSSGTLPDGRSFAGPKELRQILRDDPGFPRCFAEKLLTYALGRGLEPYDRPAVLRIVEEARTQRLRFSSFIHAIVATDAFTMRRTAGGER